MQPFSRLTETSIQTYTQMISFNSVTGGDMCTGVQIDDKNMNLWSFIFQHMLNPKKPGDTRYLNFFPPKIQNPRRPPKI